MQTIKLDLAKRYTLENVLAKQGDVGRHIAFSLTNEDAPYPIPSGAVFTVWYSGASGEGNYTSVGQHSAFNIVGDTVEVELITQMLVNPGSGTMCLTMHLADGTQIGLWNLCYICEPVPGADSAEAKTYFTAFSEMVKDVLEGVGSATPAEPVTPDKSLTKTGVPADAKAAGDMIRGRAPGKYGVGTHIYGETYRLIDLNENRMPTGFYYCAVGAAGAPTSDFGGGPLFVVSWLGEEIVRQFLMSNDLSTIFTRRCVDSVWYPWVAINPPMKDGTIYRTLDMYDKKPVYAKKIHFNSLGNNNEVYQSLGLTFDTAPNLKLVSVDLVVTAPDGCQFANSPLGSGHFIHYIYDNADEWYFGIMSKFDASGYSADVTLRFTHDGV